MNPGGVCINKHASPPAMPEGFVRFDRVMRSQGIFGLDQETGVPAEILAELVAYQAGLSVPRCVYPEVVEEVNLDATRKPLGEVLHDLAWQEECQIVEGQLMTGHVHICISISPKDSVSHGVGYIQGRSAISIARRFMGRSRNFTGENLWGRGYVYWAGRRYDSRIHPTSGGSSFCSFDGLSDCGKLFAKWTPVGWR